MAKASNKTKAVLVEENEVLRGQVKTLSNKLKEVLNISGNGDVGDAKHIAVGLFKQDDKYYFAQIAYNPDNKACKILSIEHASRVPEASHLAQMNFEKYVAENIFKKLED